jgi:glycosyltransferase involved in cell wall biosynthesis
MIQRTTAVIPVHNRESLIGQAIASAQQQTRPLDEIVVVDDASTDNTPDMVDELAQNDKRVRLIRLPRNQGPSAARNYGIKAAQCDWISFLDSDDLWMPEKHARQLEELSHRPKAIASFTGTRHRWTTGAQVDKYIKEVTLDGLRKHNCIGGPSNAIVKKAVLLQVGGFDSSVDGCEDWDLWLRLRRVGEFAIVPEPMVIYNYDVQDRVSHNKNTVLTAHARMFSRTLNDVEDWRHKREFSAYHHILLSQLFFWHFSDSASAFLAALRSLAAYPTLEAVRLLSQITRSEIRHRLAKKNPETKCG